MSTIMKGINKEGDGRVAVSLSRSLSISQSVWQLVIERVSRIVLRRTLDMCIQLDEA